MDFGFPRFHNISWLILPLFLLAASPARAQPDPIKRRLIQLGYNQHLEGRGPLSGYAFYYYNEPNFWRSNLTLRAAISPVYLDSELGFRGLFGPNTDLGVGLAGGGYADSYFEIRNGKYRRNESFDGHGGQFALSLYHVFNPGQLVPLFGILRGSVNHTVFEEDDETSADFEIPGDNTAMNLRLGFQYGGKEPTMTAPLAMELSLWYEGQFRAESQIYGFADDRGLESQAHLFWSRALLTYTFPESGQSLELTLSGGTSVKADRFSAYRLGGFLPFASAFPLNLPGYYSQELSVEDFGLLNAQYSFPLDRRRQWHLMAFGATALVGYLDGLEQPGKWHSGLGGGISYRSPSGAWMVSLIFGHGFDAIRGGDRGSNNVGILIQYDFEAQGRWFFRGLSPYRSRGLDRLFRP